MKKNYVFLGLKGLSRGSTAEFLGTSRAYESSGSDFCHGQYVRPVGCQVGKAVPQSGTTVGPLTHALGRVPVLPWERARGEGWRHRSRAEVRPAERKRGDPHPSLGKITVCTASRQWNPRGVTLRPEDSRCPD